MLLRLLKRQLHKEHKLVQFDMNQLKKLSGHDKLLLLKDLYETKDDKALLVYDKIVENGLANRLVYRDFHCLIHQCLGKREQLEKMGELFYQMQENKFLPTKELLQSWLLMNCKFNQKKQALIILQEMQSQKVDPGPEGWIGLIKVLSKSNARPDLEQCLLIYQNRTWKPTKQVYLNLLSVCTKLGDLKQGEDIYARAMDDLPRLNMRQRPGFLESTRIDLLQQYLGLLIETKQFDKGFQEIQLFRTLKRFKNMDKRQSFFHLVFKMILQSQQWDLYDKTVEWMKQSNCEPDVMHYIRWVQIESRVKRSVDHLIDSCVLRLNLTPGTIEYVNFYESCILATGRRDLYEHLERTRGTIPLKSLLSQIANVHAISATAEPGKTEE
ncbi:hypothetical protein EDD86DRAFT_197292 [Gorgonomyces haynaldii]|nr:hypothetical protein EDD86DRAFT_197292 [Gorgonomyces haynaldii]